MAVVVNTIQAQPRWAASHVGEEGCVAVPPALANGNAASAVVFKIAVARGVAGALHIEPRLVLTGTLLAVGLTMGLTDGAATSLRSAFDQIGFVDQHAGAAVTKAPVARAVGDAAMAVALSARWAERHDL